jgi:hypothetical protein
VTEYHYLPDEYDDADDPPPDGAVQVAIEGVTIYIIDEPAEAAEALYKKFGLDWSMQLSRELQRQAAFDTASRLKHRVQMPDDDGKVLPKRGKGDRWV